MKKNNIKNFLILHILLFIYSFGGIFSKFAAKEEFLSLRYLMFYGIVLFNLFIYAIVWQQIIKNINLTTAFSNKGITIIWGMIWGKIFFNEQITLYKIFGAIVIIIGIVLVVSDDSE